MAKMCRIANLNGVADLKTSLPVALVSSIGEWLCPFLGQRKIHEFSFSYGINVRLEGDIYVGQVIIFE